jgi:hypothetical protein
MKANIELGSCERLLRKGEAAPLYGVRRKRKTPVFSLGFPLRGAF